jgi:Flp pilus assembly protein TadG
MDHMRRHNQIRRENGQTMTEFALVLPVICLLLFGVIQFGILFNNYVTLTDAVRTGARKAAVSRQTGNPTGDTVAAVRSAARDLNQAQLGVSVSPGTPWQHGQEVQVSATYPYKIDLLGFVLASGQLRSTTRERVE